MGYTALFNLFILFFTVLSCGSSKNKAVQQHQDSVQQVTAKKDTLPIFDPVPPAPAPGTVRLKGKIIEVSSSKNDASAKVQFKVIQILGYGSSTPPLAIQDTLEIMVSKNQEMPEKSNVFIGILSHKFNMVKHADSTLTWHLVHVESKQNHQ